MVDPETIEAYIFPVDSPASETSAGTNPLGVPAGVHDFKEGETWAFLNLGGWYSTN